MSDFPPGYDCKSLQTDNDRILKQLILNQYSEDAAEYIGEEYLFRIGKKNFLPYMIKVKELLKKHLPENDFISELEDITFEEMADLPIL